MHSLTGTQLEIGAIADTSDAHDPSGFLVPDPDPLITHQGEQHFMVPDLE